MTCCTVHDGGDVVKGSLYEGELLKLPMTVNAAGFSLVVEAPHPIVTSNTGHMASA